MGEVEINTANRVFNIYSHLVLYGDAANEEMARVMSNEISDLWNEPRSPLSKNHLSTDPGTCFQ